MILKIKREDGHQDWWMLDNIRKISKSKLFTVDPKEMQRVFEEDGHDLVIFDAYFDENQASSFYYYIVLICRGETTDTEFSVAFDTVAYICNDEGKTVERIVARR